MQASYSVVVRNGLLLRVYLRLHSFWYHLVCVWSQPSSVVTGKGGEHLSFPPGVGPYMASPPVASLSINTVSLAGSTWRAFNLTQCSWYLPRSPWFIIHVISAPCLITTSSPSTKVLSSQVKISSILLLECCACPAPPVLVQCDEQQHLSVFSACCQ